jgi:hypothetical protein
MTMDVVVEMIDVFPDVRPVRSIKRDERRLFERPGAAQMKFLTAEIEPLKVYTLPAKYAPVLAVKILRARDEPVRMSVINP